MLCITPMDLKGWVQEFLVTMRCRLFFQLSFISRSMFCPCFTRHPVWIHWNWKTEVWRSGNLCYEAFYTLLTTVFLSTCHKSNDSKMSSNHAFVSPSPSVQTKRNAASCSVRLFRIPNFIFQSFIPIHPASLAHLLAENSQSLDWTRQILPACRLLQQMPTASKAAPICGPAVLNCGSALEPLQSFCQCGWL